MNSSYIQQTVPLRVWEWEREGMRIAHSGIPYGNRNESKSWEWDGKEWELNRWEWEGMGMIKAIPAHL